jgi:hypothetical protein
VATSRWPKISNFAYAATATLPAPTLADLDWRNTAPADRAARRALRDAMWSQQVTLVLNHPALPVPEANVFKLPESIRVTMLYSPPSARKEEPTAPVAHEEASAGKQASARAGKSGRQAHAAAARKSAKHAARPTKNAKHAKHGGKGASKHEQAKPAKPKKNKVREASLKKR